MTECIITLLLLTCPDMPKLSPAEAAAILAPHQFQAAPLHVSPAPRDRVTTPKVERSKGVHGSGPFGDFKPFPPRRRLDGTLLSTPPLILGLPTYHPYNMYRNYGVVMPQTDVVVVR